MHMVDKEGRSGKLITFRNDSDTLISNAHVLFLNIINIPNIWSDIHAQYSLPDALQLLYHCYQQL